MTSPGAALKLVASVFEALWDARPRQSRSYEDADITTGQRTELPSMPDKKKRCSAWGVDAPPALVHQDCAAAGRIAVPRKNYLVERKNGYQKARMVEVVRYLMVIAAYMALPNEKDWAAGRLIVKERRQIALVFNFEACGPTELA
ncbi:hypothetical protein ACVWZM_004666 [Bradyrhizobium sp. USDA 4501]